MQKLAIKEEKLRLAKGGSNMNKINEIFSKILTAIVFFIFIAIYYHMWLRGYDIVYTLHKAKEIYRENEKLKLKLDEGK